MKKTEYFCWTWRQHEEFFNIYKILLHDGGLMMSEGHVT